VGDNIDSAILPRKFLELIVLKKLNLNDSALKTKTKEFVIVPDTLDVAQLTKYPTLYSESSSAMTQCSSKSAVPTTARSRTCGWPPPTTPSAHSLDLMAILSTNICIS
jgi:hypothetical protein